MYKIKFLERIETNEKGNMSKEKFMSVAYNDAELPVASTNWRAMGFVEIREIECFPKATKTPAQIVELFYADKAIVNGKEIELSWDADDKKIKESLLQKYSDKKRVVTTQQIQIPSGLQDRTPEEEKVFRKKIFDALKDKGVNVVKNIKTEMLIAKAKENGIEI